MSAAAAYRDDSAQISLRSGDDRAVCGLCPHACRLRPGETGFCRTRENRAGTIRPLNYGRFTSLALDPIEKKPLYHFHPGSFILSVGSFGCNLACPFCQNASIAMADASAATEDITPARLAVVLVTNGTICAAPRARLLPHVDAMNIDLKGWQEDFYRWVGGDLGTVRETIEHAVTHGVHVEVTTLIIPGRNDSAADMDAEARWLASLSPEIPLHISRYFPRHRVSTPPTPVAAIDRLAEIARRHLRHVHRGNC